MLQFTSQGRAVRAEPLGRSLCNGRRYRWVFTAVASTVSISSGKR